VQILARRTQDRQCGVALHEIIRRCGTPGMRLEGRRGLMRCVTRTLARTVSGIVPTGASQSPHTTAGLEGSGCLVSRCHQPTHTSLEGGVFGLRHQDRTSSLKAEVSSDGIRALTAGQAVRDRERRQSCIRAIQPASIGKDFCDPNFRCSFGFGRV
jgi:hypothetical protein